MIPFPAKCKPSVTDAEMAKIYEAIKTPVKRGAVIKWENDFTDSPTVFQKDGIFYMYFIAISKDCSVSGYETHLASSADLLHWDYRGPIFRRNDLDRWDSKQCAGYAAFKDIAFDGTNALESIGGRYYITYHSIINKLLSLPATATDMNPTRSTWDRRIQPIRQIPMRLPVLKVRFFVRMTTMPVTWKPKRFIKAVCSAMYSA